MPARSRQRLPNRGPERLSRRKGPLSAESGGFSLHAGAWVAARDRERLEKLCCYAGRPAVAESRLVELGGGAAGCCSQHPAPRSTHRRPAWAEHGSCRAESATLSAGTCAGTHGAAPNRRVRATAAALQVPATLDRDSRQQPLPSERRDERRDGVRQRGAEWVHRVGCHERDRLREELHPVRHARRHLQLRRQHRSEADEGPRQVRRRQVLAAPRHAEESQVGARRILPEADHREPEVQPRSRCRLRDAGLRVGHQRARAAGRDRRRRRRQGHRRAVEARQPRQAGRERLRTAVGRRPGRRVADQVRRAVL
ncbi:MAG: transposase, partial [Planctomycetes bacterium]|nr:transposase [Planctomycetota bacterium]